MVVLIVELKPMLHLHFESLERIRVLQFVQTNLLAHRNNQNHFRIHPNDTIHNEKIFIKIIESKFEIKYEFNDRSL